MCAVKTKISLAFRKEKIKSKSFFEGKTKHRQQLCIIIFSEQCDRIYSRYILVNNDSICIICSCQSNRSILTCIYLCPFFCTNSANNGLVLILRENVNKQLFTITWTRGRLRSCGFFSFLLTISSLL